MFATLNASGKVPYNQLPDKVKKVKYIKKERRNFFHKVIPISFFVDDGNYNPQINGRYEDWYCSWFPVFKIKQGKKFRLFICRHAHDNSYNNDILNRNVASIRHLRQLAYDYLSTSRVYRLATAQATLLNKDVEPICI